MKGFTASRRSLGILIVLGLVTATLRPLSAGQLEKLGAAEQVTAKLVSNVTAIEPGKPLVLGLKFDIPDGYYFYYKSPGYGPGVGLVPKFSFEVPEGFKAGAVQFPVPEIKHQKVGDAAAISHIYNQTDTVIFVEVTPPADLKPGSQPSFTAQSEFQYCNADRCSPPKLTKHQLILPVGKANLSDDADAIESAQRQLPVPGSESKYAKIHAALNQDKLRPGDQAKLAVIIDVEPGFKIQQNRPVADWAISTNVVLDRPEGIEEYPIPTYPPALPPSKTAPGLEPVNEYRDRAVVVVPIVANDDLKGPAVTLSGLVRYQACTVEGTCYAPIYASFSLDVPVADKGAPVNQTNSELFAAASTGLGFRVADVANRGLGWVLLGAFLGGLILNIMPCVLPVIAIKAMSFVHQAGESRQRVFLLNLSYSIGVLVIFMTLATLVAVLGMKWGELFQSAEFNIVMLGVLFAMGLSLLGVYEIPVPGFIGSSAAHSSKKDSSERSSPASWQRSSRRPVAAPCSESRSLGQSNSRLWSPI